MKHIGQFILIGFAIYMFLGNILKVEKDKLFALLFISYFLALGIVLTFLI